jgi:CubicO group peptidase (beta-lactamase class C family)
MDRVKGHIMKISRAWAAAALACMIGQASAQTAPHNPAAAPAQPAHDLTETDLSAWLDGMVPLAIGRGDIAGAVVVVVKDGHVLVVKGYGMADVKSGKPVDPARTLFRPGSISKLFTWTAVMQLVEQKKLDLDADVNTYLDFTIPKTHGVPVTLRDLMTHRSGFEETIKRLFAVDPKRMPKLGDGLKAWVPDEIFTPGETPAYSNYGAALAGYIVQRVSGETFEDYVAHHIFNPLGMTHASFVQPLPAALAPDMSSGYDKGSDDAKKFELIWMSPAGGLSASGGDIAKFMLAYLGGGAPILRPETVKLMHSEIYQRNPPLPGIGLGFYHEDTNGHIVVGHAGDTVAFHSDLHLIPDAGVGLFYSQNSVGKENSGIRGPLFRQFMDRYFPAPASPAEPTLASAKTDGALVAGMYESSRRSESSFFRIGNEDMKVSLNDDGTLSAADFKALNGEPRRWREVKPFVWREVGGPHTLVAKRVDGKVVEIASDLYPQVWILTPTPFWSSGAWNVPLLIATLAMLLLTVVFWPVKAVLRWRYNSPFPLQGRAATVYRLTRVAALIDLLFIGGFLGALTYGGLHLEFFDSTSDWIFLSLETLGVIAIIGTVFPLYELKLALGDPARPWWTKLTDALLALAALAVVWFALSLNFVNFHFNY